MFTKQQMDSISLVNLDDVFAEVHRQSEEERIKLLKDLGERKLISPDPEDTIHYSVESFFEF